MTSNGSNVTLMRARPGLAGLVPHRVESGCCGYRGGLVFKAHMTLVSLKLRLQDVLGPVKRVKKKRRRVVLMPCSAGVRTPARTQRGAAYRGTSLIRNHSSLGPYSSPMPREGAPVLAW